MGISQNQIDICKRKKRYPNIYVATVYARLINKKYKDSPEQRPYQCPVCKKYHLTCGSS